MKSPFLVFQHAVPFDLCFKIAADIRVEPDKDQDGIPQPMGRHHKESQDKLNEYLKPLIPTIEKHYGLTYKGTEQFFFQQFPVTVGKEMAEEPQCQNSIYKRKRWIRINDRDLTGVIWLKDYQDTYPFHPKNDVLGGKLEFKQYNFGFQPQAGTIVIYPADNHFVHHTTAVAVGELQLARFNIYSSTPWIYDPSQFSGDFRTWFTEVI